MLKDYEELEKENEKKENKNIENLKKIQSKYQVKYIKLVEEKLMNIIKNQKEKKNQGKKVLKKCKYEIKRRNL